MRTPSTERIDQLALVWLLVPSNKGPAEFAKQLKTVVPGADDRTRLVAECAARLRERGMIHPRWFQLNEAGRNEALKSLGFSRNTEKIKWPWAKKALLLRSLGTEPTQAAVNTAGRADVLAARILIREYKLDRKVETCASHPDESKKVASRVVAALARRALGIEGTDTLKFDDAFSVAFLTEPPLRLAECELPEFASRVTDAARTSVTGRWHDAVFISHVWNALRARGDVGITFENFQRRLIEAFQERLIELSRADLVEAMPAADVSASETVHSGARFHFVRVEQLAS